MRCTRHTRRFRLKWSPRISRPSTLPRRGPLVPISWKTWQTASFVPSCLFFRCHQRCALCLARSTDVGLDGTPDRQPRHMAEDLEERRSAWESGAIGSLLKVAIPKSKESLTRIWNLTTAPAAVTMFRGPPPPRCPWELPSLLVEQNIVEVIPSRCWCWGRWRWWL